MPDDETWTGGTGLGADSRRDPSPTRPAETRPRIGGWLLILCRLLIVWQPLTLALTGPAALDSLALRGPGLAVILVARVLVSALGIAAGLALQNRRAGAVGLAQVALIVSAAMDVLVYTTPYYPNNRPPGDTPFYIAGSIAFCGVWLVYLWRSRRVRSTFA